MTADPRRPFFLIGCMGCGKSTVGPALAARLGWRFVDTDRRIEQEQGRSIERIFRDRGEAHFRELESQAVRQSARAATVVAAGGGAFLSYANRRFMRQMGRTVWLDVPLGVVRQRLLAGAARPLWNTADPLKQRLLYERRRAVYALAAYRVAADNQPPDALAARIASEIP